MAIVPPTATQPSSAAPAAGAPVKKRVSSRKPSKAPTAAKAARVGVAAKTPKPAAAPRKAGAGTDRAAAAPAKSERVKLVRDSFTMPKADFEMIDALKQRALKQGREVKKSELLRAGLHALAALSETAFGTAVAAVPRLKTGRPHQKKGK